MSLIAMDARSLALRFHHTCTFNYEIDIGAI